MYMYLKWLDNAHKDNIPPAFWNKVIGAPRRTAFHTSEALNSFGAVGVYEFVEDWSAAKEFQGVIARHLSELKLHKRGYEECLNTEPPTEWQLKEYELFCDRAKAISFEIGDAIAQGLTVRLVCGDVVEEVRTHGGIVNSERYEYSSTRDANLICQGRRLTSVDAIEVVEDEE